MIDSTSDQPIPGVLLTVQYNGRGTSMGDEIFKSLHRLGRDQTLDVEIIRRPELPVVNKLTGPATGANGTLNITS